MCLRAGLKQIDAREYTVWDLYQAAQESQVQPGLRLHRPGLWPAHSCRER